jgi:hypothetical protein
MVTALMASAASDEGLPLSAAAAGTGAPGHSAPQHPVPPLSVPPSPGDASSLVLESLSPGPAAAAAMAAARRTVQPPALDGGGVPTPGSVAGPGGTSRASPSPLPPLADLGAGPALGAASGPLPPLQGPGQRVRMAPLALPSRPVVL